MRLLRVGLILVALAAAVWVVLWRSAGDTSAPSAESDDAVEVASGRVETTLNASLDELIVVREDRQPYQRALFGEGWIDADGDCRDTRAEVLARDSHVGVGDDCRVLRGEWLSYYDDKTWTESHQVQIDHLVPLAEAWDSGAFQWDLETRVRYANDLDDERSLVPTTADLNYDKVAADPQHFVPVANRCRYVASWIAVKLRWNLTVDERERDALADLVADCPDEPITVDRAPITLLPFAAGTGTTSEDIELESVTVPGAERVVIRNVGERPVAMEGWVLRDEIGHGQFRIPPLELKPGRSITVHSAAGRDALSDDGDYDWYADWGDVWNNDGDTAELVDGRRTVVDSCEYGPEPPRKVEC